MSALRRGCAAFLVLAVITACADKDPVSRSIGSSDLSLDRGGGSGNNDGDDDDNLGDENRKISIVDDCDPTDPGWAPTGGCLLRSGSVSFAEFNAFLQSPLSASVVGHPAWRNQPSYLQVRDDKEFRVKNVGGRLHTFTPVAQYGGGRVPPLNIGLQPAPECQLAPGAADPFALPPGTSLHFEDLSPGIHRYQCCIHPWMRALVRITEHEGH